jgi:hypothetical protein
LSHWGEHETRSNQLLQISPHTAKDHIKAIYEHFGASSQLELIRRFRFGDAGDHLANSVQRTSG